MRPRTRTQCQDGHPSDVTSPAKDTSEDESASPSVCVLPPSISCNHPPTLPPQFDESSSTLSLRDDDSVFAVPSIFSMTKRAPSSVGSSSTSAHNRVPVLVELPAEVLIKIMGYLSYRNVSTLRLVSRRFNELCASVLNSTFLKLQNSMTKRLQCIKDKMPRRESARRNHPLARENDIVETVQMRLTLLQMTFGRHIDRKHVCFFAGEILDEVYTILRYMKNNPNMTKCLKVTDELCDLCTMAMEYFKDRIEPTLPEITFFATDFPSDFTTTYTTPSKRHMRSGASAADSPCSSHASIAGSACSEPWGGMGMQQDDELGSGSGTVGTGNGGNVVLRKRVRKMGKDVKKCGDELVEVRGELKAYKAKLDTQTKQATECARKMDEYDRKFEQNDRKVQSIVAELNKCRNELKFWRSKAAPLASSSSPGNTRGEVTSATSRTSASASPPPNVFPPITCSKCDTVIELNPNDVDEAAVLAVHTINDEMELEPRVLRSGPPSPSAVTSHSAPRKRKAPKDDDGNATRKSLRGAGVKNSRKKPKLAGN